MFQRHVRFEYFTILHVEILSDYLKSQCVLCSVYTVEIARRCPTFVFPAEKPQSLSAAERVMGVLGWVIALGIILSIVGTVYLVKKQQQHKHAGSDNDS